ncbi:prefoldin subunit, partial [Salmonella sp. s51228]|uniref:prefoldin subunit n=1 Tax=Salmonella sp. s51228 TaxID=3159652 RepID=UPI00398015F1
QYIMADEVIRKALLDHQNKVIENVQKVNVAESQIEALQRTASHAMLTSEELSNLPGNLNLYEAVGRMFLLQTSSQIQTMLRERRETAEKKIKT